MNRLPITIIKDEFYKIVKTIYVQPDSKYFDIDEQGNKLVYEKTSFQIDMILYLLLSQYFKKIKIKFGGELKDLRISFFLIMPSRLGKGQLIKVVESVGKNIGLKIKRISYLNQASLIGSLNGSAMDYNMNHNYQPNHPKYKNPVMYGALATTDIIIFPEAKKLVKGSNEADTEFILSTLQEALDYPGVINKELKFTDFPITYESTSSVFATTYFLTEISELLLTQGFFQRIVTFKQDYTLKQIEDLRIEIIEKYRSTNTKVDFENQSKDFSEAINGLNNNEKILEMDNQAVDMLHDFNKVFFENIRKITGKQLEILKSFSQTIIEIIVRIAGINCCVREGNKIIVQDMTPAIETFNKFYTTIIDELVVIEKSNPLLELKNRIIQLYKKYVSEKGNFPSKSDLITYCRSQGLSYVKTQNTINIMEKENYFLIIISEHNKQILKLIEE